MPSKTLERYSRILNSQQLKCPCGLANKGTLTWVTIIGASHHNGRDWARLTVAQRCGDPQDLYLTVLLKDCLEIAGSCQLLQQLLSMVKESKTCSLPRELTKKVFIKSNSSQKVFLHTSPSMIDSPGTPTTRDLITPRRDNTEPGGFQSWRKLMLR